MEEGCNSNKEKSVMGLQEHAEIQLRIDVSGLGSVRAASIAISAVTRGSSILKVIDIPFEHAVKYHTWLGHLTMVFVVGHGIAYGIFYGLRGDFLTFFAWQRYGIANMPGVIAMVAGMLMWAISFAAVRRRFFNMFFGIHQLYFVFFIFTAWHVGVRLTLCFFGAIFLFFIDRFLRFLQSRNVVHGIYAKVLPSGIVELKLPISSDFYYTPLSFMFLNVRGLSRWEWHPFSTSSSPLDNTKLMSIGIKPLGDWTSNLHKAVLSDAHIEKSKKSYRPAARLQMQVYAEGPYGHESDYFLRYKHLVLVAGGIGVTPLMAIIQDISYRHRLHQEGLPSTVDLIWCVKQRSELSTLAELYPTRIFPEYKNSDFRITVKAYITGHHLPVEAITSSDKVSPLNFELHDKISSNLNNVELSEHPEVVSPIVGGSSDLLLAAVICASTTGWLLFLVFFRVYVYWNYTDANNMKVKQLPGWIDVLLFFLSIFIGIAVFGGAVVYGSCISRRFLIAKERVATKNGARSTVQTQFDADVEENGTNLVDQSAISTGVRPNFSELFNGVQGEYGGSDVGVLLSGPESLQVQVASECRSQNFKQWQTQFHYHSVSFDL